MQEQNNNNIGSAMIDGKIQKIKLKMVKQPQYGENEKHDTKQKKKDVQVPTKSQSKHSNKKGINLDLEELKLNEKVSRKSNNGL